VRRRRERLSAARWSLGPERRENKTEGCDYAREKIGFDLAFGLESWRILTFVMNG
jgi:hypothetical protein